MITQYLNYVISIAKYEILEDGTYYGEIPGFDGVWANAKSLYECQQELKEILEEWLIIKIRKSHFIPTVGTYDLNQVLCES